jgi:hypothetical protein
MVMGRFEGQSEYFDIGRLSGLALSKNDKCCFIVVALG